MNASLQVAGSKLCHTWSRRKLYQCQSTQCLPRPADADAGEHAFSYQLTRSPNSKVHAFVNLVQLSVTEPETIKHRQFSRHQRHRIASVHCITMTCSRQVALSSPGKLHTKGFLFAAKLPHGRRSCCMTIWQHSAGARPFFYMSLRSSNLTLSKTLSSAQYIVKPSQRAYKQAQSLHTTTTVAHPVNECTLWTNTSCHMGHDTAISGWSAETTSIKCNNLTTFPNEMRCSMSSACI